MKKLLSSPDCGSIQRVDSCFSFPGDRAFFESNIRTRADGDPMGALGDLGWYCVRLGIIAYSKGTGIRFPVSCSAVCNTWTTDGEVRHVTTLTSKYLEMCVYMFILLCICKQTNKNCDRTLQGVLYAYMFDWRSAAFSYYDRYRSMLKLEFSLEIIVRSYCLSIPVFCYPCGMNKHYYPY